MARKTWALFLDHDIMRPLHRPWEEGMLSAAPRFEVLAMDGWQSRRCGSRLDAGT